MVAQELGVPQASLCLVAAHTWDIATGSDVGVSCPDELWQAAERSHAA